MAKKKKRSKKKIDNAPAHQLPDGFWRQVGAIALIALSIMLVIVWFNAGGPVLEWLNKAILDTVGYTLYVIPVIFIYVAVEIFKAEDNRLPFVMKAATVASLVWFSGLFGLFSSQGKSTGGLLGVYANNAMLALVDSGVAAFIYVLLILITLLFILRLSPFTVIQNIWYFIRPDSSEEDANIEVMRHAAAVDGTKTRSGKLDLKVNAPGISEDDEASSKKRRGLSSLKNSVKQDKVAEEQTALVTVSDPNWKAPSLSLLSKKKSPPDPGDVQQNAAIIKDTLNEFGINVDMEGANIGPRVTQFTLRPQSGVKLGRITALETNIALNLAAKSLRMEAPIPGQRAVGIEVPNKKAADVRLYSSLSNREWTSHKDPLTFAIGEDIAGETVLGELHKMPHLLIAGQTGSGKSVMVNTLLTSLLYRNSPSDLRLILVDPKQVEMAQYDDIPHLLTPVITEPEKTISALKWAVNEMQRRYTLLAENRVKDIKTYNNMMRDGSKKITVKDDDGADQEHENGAMPYIVIVIDELADLMMLAARDVESLIVRLAQKARAVGIHLVLATQSPRADVITGLIKANVPARIAFTVSSQIESRIILDQLGAEKLLGQGDMLLYTTDMGKPRRVQGAWVTDDEVKKITDHMRMQSPPQYNDDVVSMPVQLNGKGGVVMDMDGSDDEDDLYKDAIRVVVESGKASTSLLQRRLRIGYSRAARIIESMEDQGVIGPADGSRPRDVLISSMDDIGSSDDSGEV